MKEELEDSAKYLMEKLREIIKLCKDDDLTGEEKSYLIEVLSRKMEKKLKENFLKTTEETDDE